MNIPLVEALEQILGYLKFIKDLVTNKKTMCFKTMDNLHYYSAIASRSLVEKKNIRELSRFLILKGLLIKGLIYLVC